MELSQTNNSLIFVTFFSVFGVPLQLFWLKRINQPFLLIKRLILHSSPLSIENISLHNSALQ